MKDKFWNISAVAAIYELTELLQKQQDNRSRDTGFGYGFDRWVMSCDLLKHLNSLPNRSHIFTYREIRLVYQELAARNLIEMKQWRGYGMCCYSTLGWEGCRNIGDYFIEDETIDSH